MRNHLWVLNVSRRMEVDWMIVGVRPRHLVLSSANKPPRVAQGAHEIGGARCVPNGRSKVLEVPYEIKHDCARLGGVFPAHPSCCSGAGVLCVVSPIFLNI